MTDLTAIKARAEKALRWSDDNNDPYECVFIVRKELPQLLAHTSSQQARIEELREYVKHAAVCRFPSGNCDCGLHELLGYSCPSPESEKGARG